MLCDKGAVVAAHTELCTCIHGVNYLFLYGNGELRLLHVGVNM